MRYRKKPVEVEAIQWTGDNYEEVHKIIGVVSYADKGDYIVKRISGDIIIVPPDIFKETYEEVE